MRITIDLDGAPLEFTRNSFTGSTKLRFAGIERRLQDPLDPATHFSLELVQRWECRIAQHVVVIEKQRPRLLAGFRPQTYRVLVDGKLVAEQRGF